MKAKWAWWQKWRHRFQTTVRYRLWILTSAPIFLTLLALIAITIYWSLHYTWNSALIDVSERLGVAQNSVTLLQQKQANHVRAFAESYDFASVCKSRKPSVLCHVGCKIKKIAMA